MTKINPFFGPDIQLSPKLEHCNPDALSSKAQIPLPAPLKPRHGRNSISSELRDDSIAKMNTEDHGGLLSDGFHIFATHHQRDGFVQFDSISEIQTADRYIEFLRQAGFGKRELDLVSGVTIRIRNIGLARWVSFRNLTFGSVFVRPDVITVPRPPSGCARMRKHSQNARPEKQVFDLLW